MATVVMHSNSDIFLVEQDSYFEDTVKFEGDKLPGLQVAFGLTAYDGNYEMLNDTEYVEVKARIRSWSPEQDTTLFRDIPIRPCTRADLGLDPESE